MYLFIKQICVSFSFTLSLVDFSSFLRLGGGYEKSYFLFVGFGLRIFALLLLIELQGLFDHAGGRHVTANRL